MNKKIYLFFASVLLILTIMVVFMGMQLQQTVVGSMISSKELENLKEELCLTEDTTLRILCNGEEIPYDEAYETFYLPQLSSRQWLYEMKFSVSDSDMEVYWCEDPYWKRMEDAIAEGHVFEFVFMDQQSLQMGKIVFTGLPILNLDKIETLEEDYFYCKVTVIDPFHNNSGRYEITHCYGYYDLRGKTSRIFPKKGWNLDLVNEDGTPFHMEMMGLRKDDDWKLNALYSDETKVKEMVCMDLWNEIAEKTESPYDAGSDMEFFELVVDDEYQGLYGMMEQIDFKQLSLNKDEDVLYKGYSWPEEDDRYVEDFTNRGHYSGQVIKPGNQPITSENWQPIVEYIKATNFDYAEESVDADELYEYVQEHMDLENVLNIDLYIQALYASDNLYKNLYISADRKSNGDYTLWKLPWDLNYTFGEDFLLEEDDRTIYNLEWSQEIMPDFMITEILLKSGNQKFTKALNAKWQELSNGILSTQNVKKIAEEHRELLCKSGAILRDAEKWPESPHNNSLDQMLEFHERRMEFLNDYYTSE